MKQISSMPCRKPGTHLMSERWCPLCTEPTWLVGFLYCQLIKSIVHGYLYLRNMAFTRRVREHILTVLNWVDISLHSDMLFWFRVIQPIFALTPYWCVLSGLESSIYRIDWKPEHGGWMWWVCYRNLWFKNIFESMLR